MPLLRRCSPTKLWDGAQMAIFGDFLGTAFAASRVQHLLDLHSKFALWPHHDVQPAAAEIRRGKKEDRRQKEITGQKIMACRII